MELPSLAYDGMYIFLIHLSSSFRFRVLSIQDDWITFNDEYVKHALHQPLLFKLTPPVFFLSHSHIQEYKCNVHKSFDEWVTFVRTIHQREGFSFLLYKQPSHEILSISARFDGRTIENEQESMSDSTDLTVVELVWKWEEEYLCCF